MFFMMLSADLEENRMVVHMDHLQRRHESPERAVAEISHLRLWPAQQTNIISPQSFLQKHASCARRERTASEPTSLLAGC